MKNKKKRNIKSEMILDSVRTVCMIVFLILLLCLMPNILNAGWQGITFFLLSIVFIALSLYMMIIRKNIMTGHIAYHILYIGMVFYLSLIFCKLFFDSRVQLTMIYEIDMTYFKMNYFLLSIVIMGIMLYTLLFLLEDKESVK